MSLARISQMIKNKVQRVEAERLKVKTVAETVLESLVQNTPVDTSLALSNWIVKIGSPFSGEIDAHVQGKKGSSKNASIATALSNGIAEIATRKEGQDIYISNNLDYIKALDDGSRSRQNRDFVKKALDRGRAIIGELK